MSVTKDRCQLAPRLRIAPRSKRISMSQPLSNTNKNFYKRRCSTYCLSCLYKYTHPVYNINKLCGRPPQYAPAPVTLTFGPRKRCPSEPSHVWRDYFCVNFSLPRPLCSRLSPDICDKTDVRQHHRLMPPPHEGHNKQIHIVGEHFKLKIHQNTTNSYFVDVSDKIPKCQQSKNWLCFDDF